MKKCLTQALPFLQDEAGASAIEYALLGGLIAVVIVAAVTAFGTKLAGSFTSSTAKLPS
jgi:pilus assembly protein Flp/PilA